MQRSNIVDMSYCKLKYDVAYHEECREGCWVLSAWSLVSPEDILILQRSDVFLSFKVLEVLWNGFSKT